MCAGLALYLLQQRGYPYLVLVLAPLVTAFLWQLCRDLHIDSELRWQRGLWTLEHGGVERGIALSASCTVTRWVIYLSFTEQPSGRDGHVWLFADSASPAQLRRLRVRLNLEH